MPISLEWVGKVPEAEGEEDGPDICSLRGAWHQVKGWRSHPVVSIGGQYEFARGTWDRYSWMPFQEVYRRLLLTQRMDSPAENMAHLSGLRVRGLVTCTSKKSVKTQL